MANGIHGAGSAGGLMQDVLRALQKSQEEMLEQQVGPALDAATLATSGSSAMMSRNFASASGGGSDLVEAVRAGKAAQQQMYMQQTSRMAALLNSLGGIQGPSAYGPGGKGAVQKATIDRAIERIMAAESAEASQRNLDEIKDGIEEKARQATAPTDADGQPIDVPGSGSTDVPMPEISGSGSSAPLPPVSGSGGQASAPPAAVLSPAGSSGAASSAPSLDVVV